MLGTSSKAVRHPSRGGEANMRHSWGRAYKERTPLIATPSH